MVTPSLSVELFPQIVRHQHLCGFDRGVSRRVSCAVGDGVDATAAASRPGALPAANPDDLEKIGCSYPQQPEDLGGC